tara:strand:+ start:266 stop:445 length:180 start_codon:yes stop_codon:yes gene_type:complete
VVRHLKVSSKLRGSNVPPQTVDGEASKHTCRIFIKSDEESKSSSGIVALFTLQISMKAY